MNPNTNNEPINTQPNNNPGQIVDTPGTQPQPQPPQTGPAPQAQFTPSVQQSPPTPTPPKKSKKLIIILIVIFVLLAGVGLYVLLAGSEDSAQTTTATPAQTNTADSDEELVGFSTTPTVENNDEVLADANLKAIHGQLEAYFAQNGHYPSTASSEVMPNADPAIFEVPENLSLTYTPTPETCTTETQDCTSYTLTLSRSDGSIISTKESLNN